MDDVHHLEHDARPLLVRPGARRDEEQVARRQILGDLVWNRHRERAREVVDRVAAQIFEPTDLVVRFGIELVQPQEPIDLGVIDEPELVPVDHRVAAQQQAHRLDVAARSAHPHSAGARRAAGRGRPPTESTFVLRAASGEVSRRIS